MTTTETRRADECPACGHDGTLALSSGTRYCPWCRHEWNPADTNETPTPPATELHAVPDVAIVIPRQCPVCGLVMELDAGDVYQCSGWQDASHVRYYEIARSHHADDDGTYPTEEAAEGAQLDAARARFVGAEAVVHELEATGTIDQIDADGMARITFGSGFFVWCSPDEFSVIEAPPVPSVVPDDEQEALAATSLVIVAQIIRAAQETLVTLDGVRSVGLPPNGWLPTDADAIPMIEWGAAYAVASIVWSCGITDEQLEVIASSYDKAAEAAREATEL